MHSACVHSTMTHWSAKAHHTCLAVIHPDGQRIAITYTALRQGRSYAWHAFSPFSSQPFCRFCPLRLMSSETGNACTTTIDRSLLSALQNTFRGFDRPMCWSPLATHPPASCTSSSERCWTSYPVPPTTSVRQAAEILPMLILRLVALHVASTCACAGTVH